MTNGEDEQCTGGHGGGLFFPSDEVKEVTKASAETSIHFLSQPDLAGIASY